MKIGSSAFLLLALLLACAAPSALGQGRFRDRFKFNNREPDSPERVGGEGVYSDEEPLSPAFTATRATDRTQSAANGNSDLRFEHTITNTGLGFESSRGEFVAPTRGVYAFSWSAVSPPGRVARVSLTKNGREVDVHLWAEEDGYQAASNTAVLELKAGDRVGLRLDAGGKVYEPNGTRSGYTTFTGYRVN